MATFYSSFKTMFNKKAVIVPVLIPEPKNILRACGRWDITSGLTVTPRPKPMETARIKRFLVVSSHLERVLIPAAATIPNITMPAPPNTGFGIIAIKAPIFGNIPSSIRSID